MPLYAYEAMDKAGSPLTGKVDAEHELMAASRLRKMGYTVLEIAEVKESPLQNLFKLRRKIALGDILFFTRQLAAMLAAGIPLTRCLYTLSGQSENPEMARILNEVARNVEGGMSISESMRGYPEVFTSMYVDMVKAGEVGGALEEMLGRMADQLEKDKQLRDNIRSATIYPIVILVFAGCVLLLMMFFIVPVFVGFFPAGQPLPLPTKIVIGLSESLRHFWYVYLLGLVLAVLGVRMYTASEHGRRLLDRMKFRLPVFGNLFKKATIARFTRTLATLLAGGVPVLQSLDAAGPASGSIKLAEVIKEAGEQIQEGRGIAPPLAKSGFFPPMVVDMVSVGEETGQLSALLGRVAGFYEDEVATMTKGLTSLIEPIMIIIVGCLIGAILISVYLPIFSVVTSMGG
ncbi:MAG: type II secretion system F family protein [Bacillota bacterium]